MSERTSVLTSSEHNVASDAETPCRPTPPEPAVRAVPATNLNSVGPVQSDRSELALVSLLVILPPTAQTS